MDDDTLLDDLYTREYFQQSDVCRLCWSKNAHHDLISENDTKIKNQLFFKVQDCLDINMSEGNTEKFPRKLCEMCFYRVDNFHEFKTYCREQDKKLHEILLKGHTKSAEASSSVTHLVKIEMKEENSESSISDSDSLDSLLESSDPVLKLLEMSEPSIAKRKIETKRRKGTTYCNSCYIDFNDKESITAHNFEVHGIDSNGLLKCFGCEKRFEKRTTRLGHETRSCKVLRDGYKCKICNKLLPKRGLYERHFMGHNKNKQADSLLDSSDSVEVVFTDPGPSTVDEEESNQKKGPYYCYTCRINLSDEKALEKHRLEVHGVDTTGFSKCFACEKRFEKRENRNTHEALHCKFLKEGFKCSICNEFLPNRYGFEKHMKCHILNKPAVVPEKVQCDRCARVFVSKRNLIAHLASHEQEEPTSFVCDICGKVFKKRKALYQHHHMEHTERANRKYQCPHCPYHSVHIGSLNVHLRKHTGERPFLCDLCPHRSVNSSNLAVHRRTHTAVLPYECHICSKKFVDKKNCSDHIAATHEGTRAYSCSICGSTYTRQRGLRRHERQKHGIKPKPSGWNWKQRATDNETTEPADKDGDIDSQGSAKRQADQNSSEAKKKKNLDDNSAKDFTLNLANVQSGVNLTQSIEYYKL